MTERVHTVVIGGGQAGLSASYHLTQQGREHVVLEAGRVGETWRTGRWDGFYLNTPNLGQRLPGHEYEGADPDGFFSRDEIVTYLDEYADAFAAPVRTGARVSALRQRPGGGYRVELDGDQLDADNVVVATGAFQRPTPSPRADAAPADVLQLHTSGYRRPEQIADGAVLIVGNGQSGCQIADELMQAGRTTNPAVSGNDGGHDCHARWLARRGAVLLGRIQGFRGRKVSVAPDLEENLAKGDEVAASFKREADEHVQTAGLDLPVGEPEGDPGEVEMIEELDLHSAGIGTILWANGYRPDFSWIDLPVVDGDGWAVQERGVTAFPGLYFVGLHWLHKRKSALLLGVGEDAEHVVSHITATV